jgi:hypothetical protein
MPDIDRIADIKVTAG